MTVVLPVLSAVEKDFLNECEEAISRGLLTFREVGQALIDIRDNRLYRASHETFEDYCTARWNFSFQHASRLIDAARVTELISSPIGEEINNDTVPVPANEYQTRPLAVLLPPPSAEPEVKAAAVAEIRETWTEAVATAPRDGDGTPKITAKHVAETVTKRTEAAAVSSTRTADAENHSKTRQPNRRALTDTFQKAGWELTTCVERLERLVLDDRYPRNAEQVARISRNDLLRAADLLAAVIARLPVPDE